MGLDLSHGDFYCGYISFTLWRKHIAVLEGYGLENEGRYNEYIALDWENIPDGSVEGVEDWFPNDPLLILFAHSDCGGVIYPNQCRLLADRLKDILPKMREERWEYLTRKFIKACEEAVEMNECLEFM